MGLAVGLTTAAEIALLPLGELASAERNLERSIKSSRMAKASLIEASGHRELGRLLCYRGDFPKAADELDSSTNLRMEVGAEQGVGVDDSYRALRALMMQDAQAATELAKTARHLADARRYESDIVRPEWLWGTALIMKGDFQVASAHLTDALTRCRRINLVELEPNILLAWAAWHRAEGNLNDAQAQAEEALAIADRCEYRLKQAEIHGFLARLALDAGDGETARKEAQIAKERAWCDGPPHCYKPALDEAEKMLKELGARR